MGHRLQLQFLDHEVREVFRQKCDAAIMSEKMRVKDAWSKKELPRLLGSDGSPLGIPLEGPLASYGGLNGSKNEQGGDGLQDPVSPSFSDDGSRLATREFSSRRDSIRLLE